MKKTIIFSLAILTMIFGCSKEDDKVSLSDLSLNFYNVTASDVIFIDGRAVDETISFDVFIAKPVSKDIIISISKDAESNMGDAQYALSAVELTIPAGSLKASAEVEFFYDEFTKGETNSLILSVSSNDVQGGYNSVLEINAGKIGNPLKDIFPGDYTGHYWGGDETVGDYDQGWDSPITLSFDESDPEAVTMIMNNLWWGGADLKVKFNFDDNSIYIEGGQEVDCCWENDPFYPPWSVGESTGTFDIAAKKLVFDYSVFDVSQAFYGTYTAWVTPVTSIVNSDKINPIRR